MMNFDWLGNLSSGTAKGLVLLAFIIPLVFGFSLPRKYIYQGSPDERPWRNLKVWILLLVAMETGVYLYF